jgi:endogenous inhibitor of DNA gyrase (YacG/DUF329 family)
MSITRNCPICQDLIFYKNQRNKERFEKSNSVCRKCLSKRGNDKNKGFDLIRNCPVCQSEIHYKSKNGFNTAVKNNSRCCGCVFPEERRELYREMFSGSKNYFFGKHHTDEWKANHKKQATGKPIHTNESRKKISDWQKDNAPMRGRSAYSIWVEKYGKEGADRKKEELRQKSIGKFAGEKNPMFGKPSPNGAGNGYSGWYNGLFFRSLKELVFIVKYLERFKLKYESLEGKRSGIKYFDEFSKTHRNYFGDYLVNGKYFVEIKPKKLWNTPLNSQKFTAAKEFCKNNGLIFKLIDPKIDTPLIFKLFDDNKIKFMDRYLPKFIKWRQKYDDSHNGQTQTR